MAPVKTLADRVALGPVTTRNRICIPPMVFYGHAGADGRVTEAHVAHYRALAEGGAGLIIQEATCVLPGGRLRMDQLGIWEDGQIPGLRRIAESVHGAGCPMLVQLHHGPLADLAALSRAEIDALRRAFIQGGRRAYLAGYDGVELHGCHGYLLCQFLNPRTNRRQDEYADGTALVGEILAGIRAATGPDFLVGVRLGGLEPDLAQGVAHGTALEALGADFLDVSYGFPGEMVPQAPGDPRLSLAVRAAGAMKRAVKIPVFAVDGIRTPSDAALALAETGVDMIDVGRSALVDPQWPEKALAGQTPGKCLGCKRCFWRSDPARCPGRRALRA